MFPALAQENDSEKYCFSHLGVREKLHRELTPILVPSDQVTVSDNCLTISMKPHRRELIQNYIRQHQPNVTITFSSAEIKRESCKLKVEKLTHKESTEVGASASTENVAAAGIDKSAEAKTISQIQTLGEFELSSNQDVIKGNCRFITPDRYEITLNVRKDPKPLLPAPVPPGSIVIVNSPPPDQVTSNLQTTLQLTRGSRIEIGSVVKEMREKNQGIKIDSEIRYADSNGSSTETLFLTLD